MLRLPLPHLAQHERRPRRSTQDAGLPRDVLRAGPDEPLAENGQRAVLPLARPR